MQTTRSQGPVRHTIGLIRDVDVADRELTMLVSHGAAQVFDVPTECTIVLHGEPVKLRLLLPGDYAQVAYHRREDRFIACSIQVNWWLSPTEERRELRNARMAVLSRDAEGDFPDDEPQAAAGMGNQNAARKPGVLIADPLGLTLVLLKAELEPLGFAVWLAQDGEEAIRLFRSRHEEIDLVLLDVQLPRGNGPQTLNALQQINPGLCFCFHTDALAKRFSRRSSPALSNNWSAMVVLLPGAHASATLGWRLARAPASSQPSAPIDDAGSPKRSFESRESTTAHRRKREGHDPIQERVCGRSQARFTA